MMNRIFQAGVFSLSIFLGVALAHTVRAESDDDLQSGWQGDATVQLNLFDLGDVGGSDTDTGFFDQYRFHRDKDAGTPYELLLSDVDLSYINKDGQAPWRILASTPNARNTRALLLWRHDQNLYLNARYQRYERSNLRIFPQAAGPALGSALGSQFTNDGKATSQFRIERNKAGADVTVLPGALGFSEDSFFRSLTIGSDFEKREGRRQFRFALGGSDRNGGSTNDDKRWRSYDQKIDHKILTPKAKGVFSFAGATAVLRFNYQRFEANEDPYTNVQIQAAESQLTRPPGTTLPSILTTSPKNLRTTNFIADTDRYQTNLRIARPFGTRSYARLDAHYSLLDQEKFSPQQSAAGFRHNQIMNWGVALSGNTRISDELSLNAFAKWNVRDRDVSDADIDSVSSQADERIDKREEIKLGAELTTRVPHGTAALGLGFKDVDRTVVYPDPASGIPVKSMLLKPDSQATTIYLKAHCRPIRGVNVRARIHYTDGSDVAFPTDAETEYGARVRASWTAPEQPLVVSGYGSYKKTENEDFDFTSDTGSLSSVDNHNEDTYWQVGLDTSFVPTERGTLFFNTAYTKDESDRKLIRSDGQRFDTPPVDFFVDDSLSYDNNVFTLVLGGSYQLSEAAQISAGYHFTKSDATLNGGSGGAIDNFTEIDSTIHGANIGLSYVLNDANTIGVQYNVARYSDDGGMDAARNAQGLDALSETEHTFGVSFTHHFGAGR